MDNHEFTFTKPTLTEPGTKFFLSQTLKQCHIVRDKFHNIIFNVGLLLFFVLVLGSILLYKYKGRLTPAEKQRKTVEQQQYILSKIKNLQEAKKIAHQELITGLPNWNNDF